jgi:hypothetical protein
MKHMMNKQRLKRENVAHAKTGGRSQDNAHLGFAPAFLDVATFTIYPSRFANGHPAPFHILDGLPDEAVAMRAPCGHVVAAKSTLISGFVRRGFFYTRSAAVRAMRDWGTKD